MKEGRHLKTDVKKRRFGGAQMCVNCGLPQMAKRVLRHKECSIRCGSGREEKILSRSKEKNEAQRDGAF